MIITCVTKVQTFWRPDWKKQQWLLDILHSEWLCYKARSSRSAFKASPSLSKLCERKFYLYLRLFTLKFVWERVVEFVKGCTKRKWTKKGKRSSRRQVFEVAFVSFFCDLLLLSSAFLGKPQKLQTLLTDTYFEVRLASIKETSEKHSSSVSFIPIL